MGFFDKLRGSAAAKVTDPVCGMKVDPSKAAGKSQHGGKTYHFCSPACKHSFDSDPANDLGAPES